MVLTLRIQIDDIKKPPVWRRITVPANFSFHKLHLVIQAAFGWKNAHLYQFSDNGFNSSIVIGEPGDDDYQKVISSKKVKLSEVFTIVGQKYQYIYDFGDDWLHLIKLEKIDDAIAPKADCIAGKGACPPEDSGGPWGYEALKETMANPKHPEYFETKEWLGLKKNELWDPNRFDLEDAQKKVKSV